MIVICEPICREFSHEKVNSGFIYGMRLAFPDETLRFYADKSHIKAIQDILRHDQIIVENIEYVPIKFKDSSSLSGALKYYLLFKKMFSELKEVNTDKIFFLSYSPLIIYIIKKLKQHTNFINLKFTFVLHGDFENIITEKINPVNLPVSIQPVEKFDITAFIKKVRKNKVSYYPKKIAGAGINLIRAGLKRIRINPSKWLSTKEMLLWRASPDFRYVALSPHIIKNAVKYIDTDKLNIHTVMFPTNFVKPTAQPKNEYIKFGIFGYGDTVMLRSIAQRLSQTNITQNYEIRIIGMDNRGTIGFPHITCPSPGVPLTRADMEKYAADIDVFLILYDESKYTVSCSGTIIESLSNSKPILHFNNDCINTFNTPDNPIGICCNTIDEYVNKMIDLIENYNAYAFDLKEYRNNIMKLRTEYAIKNSTSQLKDSFTW